MESNIPGNSKRLISYSSELDNKSKASEYALPPVLLVVLDILNGSGSTTIACANTDREFLGCELDEEYYEKSLKRIEDSIGIKKFTSNKLIDILK